MQPGVRKIAWKWTDTQQPIGLRVDRVRLREQMFLPRLSNPLSNRGPDDVIALLAVRAEIASHFISLNRNSIVDMLLVVF